jgi:ankyrin repeat protein
MNKYVVELDESDLICQICMGNLFQPMIASDGGVYCESCIAEWFKKNTNPPQFNKSNDKKYFKCKLFMGIYKSIDRIGCLCLDDLVDCPDVLYNDKKNATRIMGIIDAYYQNLKETDILKFTKIFCNKKMIKYLIKNTDSEWKGMHDLKLIHYLCRFGSWKMIKYYIKKGADLEAVDCDKWRPIHYICCDQNNLNSKDQLKAIKYLADREIAKTSNIGNDLVTINYICSHENNLCSTDQLVAIKYLADIGINMEIKDSNGWKPIHYICSDSNNLCSADQLVAIRYLAEKGCCLKEKNNGVRPPIHYICSVQNNMCSSDQLEAIRYLVDRGVCMDAKDCDEWNPVRYICSIMNNNMCNPDKLQAMQYLFDHGALLDDPLDGAIDYLKNLDCSIERIKMLQLIDPTNRHIVVNFLKLTESNLFKYFDERTHIDPKNRRYVVEMIIKCTIEHNIAKQSLKTIIMDILSGIGKNSILSLVSKTTYYHVINILIISSIKNSKIGDDLREIFNVIRTNVRNTKHMSKDNYDRTIKMLCLSK